MPVAQLLKSSLDVEQRKEKQKSCPRGFTLLEWKGSGLNSEQCHVLS